MLFTCLVNTNIYYTILNYTIAMLCYTQAPCIPTLLSLIVLLRFSAKRVLICVSVYLGTTSFTTGCSWSPRVQPRPTCTTPPRSSVTRPWCSSWWMCWGHWLSSTLLWRLHYSKASHSPQFEGVYCSRPQWFTRGILCARSLLREIRLNQLWLRMQFKKISWWRNLCRLLARAHAL